MDAPPSLYKMIAPKGLNWDIGPLKMGYWDIGPLNLGYWDIGPLKLGYLGYQDPL